MMNEYETLHIEFHTVGECDSLNINSKNLGWFYDTKTGIGIYKKYIEANLKVGAIYDFTYESEDDLAIYTYVVVKKENNIYYLAEYYYNKFCKSQENHLGEKWIKCDVEKKFDINLENFVVEATEKALDGMEITSYNKGKIDGIKEGIKELVKELKQHFCSYDFINYTSFEAVDIEVIIDEIAETMIKKI